MSGLCFSSPGLLLPRADLPLGTPPQALIGIGTTGLLVESNGAGDAAQVRPPACFTTIPSVPTPALREYRSTAECS